MSYSYFVGCLLTAVLHDVSTHLDPSICVDGRLKIPIHVITLSFIPVEEMGVSSHPRECDVSFMLLLLLLVASI